MANLIFQFGLDIKDALRIKYLFRLFNFRALAKESRQKLLPFYQDYISSVSTEDQAISLELAIFILVLCNSLKPKNIVDLGSGFSSFVLRFYAQNATYKPIVWSVDDNPLWLEKTKAFLSKHGVSNENLGGWDFFARQNNTKFDLILNDFSNLEVRESRFKDICGLLAPRGIILFDDMHYSYFSKFVRRASRQHNLKHYSLRLFTEDKFKRFSSLVIAL